ncbi:MAG TPA: recombinase family protein [Tepidisphaeraceae bacterium]|jgi:hypothetical protein
MEEGQANGKWDGLGAIVVVRQSHDENGTGSNAAQLDYMAQEFKRVGLRYVDKEVLDGVAASAPAKIAELIERLFKRKREKNDFHVIAWQVEDRASRGGGDHGMWLEHEAKRQGLRIFFAGDEGVSRPYDAVVRVAKFEAAKEAAVGTGRRSSQSQSYQKKLGFFRTSGPTPLGCDRLYCDAENNPRYFLRNLPDGRQEQVDYQGGVVIGRYGTVGKKSRHRFKKQRNEYSLLMPGAREQTRVVRVIFFLRYKRGWRGCRIADYLNRNHILSPKGKEWSPRQVQIIYENEAYTGVSVNDRTFSGRFFRGDKVLGYVPLDRDEIELVLKKTFSPQFKSQDQWERIDQPYMHDFLPRDVRDLAIASQAKVWSDRADPTRPARKYNRRPASDYLFSDMLVAERYGGKLVGSLSGPEGHQVAYYRHKGAKKRRRGNVLNHLIPAEPLHASAMATLAGLLLDVPDLRPRLMAALLEQRKAATSDLPDVAALEAEAEEIGAQIGMTIRTLKGAALAEAEGELQRLGMRRNAIAAQLKRLKRDVVTDARPAEEVVEEAIAVLAEDSRRLLTLPVQPLRDLVQTFITEARVDMATKAVEFVIALPTWTLQKRVSGGKASKKAEKPLCPADSSRSPSGDETQSLALVRCEYEWNRGSKTTRPCYHCHRQAA